jgi:hypothetical protein
MFYTTASLVAILATSAAATATIDSVVLEYPLTAAELSLVTHLKASATADKDRLNFIQGVVPALHKKYGAVAPRAAKTVDVATRRTHAAMSSKLSARGKGPFIGRVSSGFLEQWRLVGEDYDVYAKVVYATGCQNIGDGMSQFINYVDYNVDEVTYNGDIFVSSGSCVGTADVTDIDIVYERVDVGFSSQVCMCATILLLSYYYLSYYIYNIMLLSPYYHPTPFPLITCGHSFETEQGQGCGA